MREGPLQKNSDSLNGNSIIPIKVSNPYLQKESKVDELTRLEEAMKREQKRVSRLEEQLSILQEHQKTAREILSESITDHREQVVRLKNDIKKVEKRHAAKTVETAPALTVEEVARMFPNFNEDEIRTIHQSLLRVVESEVKKLALEEVKRKLAKKTY